MWSISHTECADIDLKKASKSFAQHYSCGSSVTGDDEVVVQGDVYDDIVDFVQDKWPQASIVCPQSRYIAPVLPLTMQVTDDCIKYIGEQKR